MKELFVAIFFLMAFIHPVVSQDLYHSPYSVYGLGLLNERTSSLNRGLGGAGIGVQDDHNLNHRNPASYASILFPVSHIFEAGSYLESNRYETNRLNESKTNGGLANLSYWFRLKPGYAATFGLSSFSSVSYNVTTTKDIAIGEEGTYNFQGKGNISQLFFGNGFRITKNLFAGVTVAWLFGSIDRDETVLSGDAGNILTLQNKMFSNKLRLDFGLQYKVNLLRKALIFGAVYNSGLTMKGKNDYLLTDLNADTLAEYSGEKVAYNLPEEFGAGLSLKSKRSVLAADFNFSRWSAAGYSDDVSFRDSWKISAGYAYFGNENAEAYPGMIGFRMGLHFQEHYLVVKDEPVANWGGNLGISLPVSDGRSLVNLTYSYDRMGTLQNNLILHTAQKIQLDIVIRDIWGRRRKFD